MSSKKPSEHPVAPKPKARPKAKPCLEEPQASRQSVGSGEQSFGKRSEVKDAHDRYANSDVSD